MILSPTTNALTCLLIYLLELTQIQIFDSFTQHIRPILASQMIVVKIRACEWSVSGEISAQRSHLLL